MAPVGFAAPCGLVEQRLGGVQAERRLVKRWRARRAPAMLDALVALTREQEKNSVLREMLTDRGIRTVDIPCIEHALLPGANELAEALIREVWGWVIVTSPEAAEVFLSAWVRAGAPDLPVAAVGGATGSLLERAGIRPEFIPSKATGKTLAAELPLGRAKRVLYPASARAGSVLQENLFSRGFEVERLDTYDTRPVQLDAVSVEIAKQVSIASFGSPSAVGAWVSQVGTPQVAACIGETTAKACKEYGIEQALYPKKPGLDGWVQVIGEAIKYVT